MEIERHRGSIIKTTGDGLLAEFGSVQDAVRSAIEIQNGMLHRERNFADNEKIEYRFGINVGDVTEDSGDIFGDSVNIAARLEALSVPGGLCVSDIVYQIIQDKITEPFKDLGSQRVKTYLGLSVYGNGNEGKIMIVRFQSQARTQFNI